MFGKVPFSMLNLPRLGASFYLGVFLLAFVLCQFNSAAVWKETEDFEFDDLSKYKGENHIDSGKTSEGLNKNSICKNLQCRSHQKCVVKSENIAICISKNKLSSTSYKNTLQTNQTPVGSSEDSDSDTDSDSEEEDPKSWPEANVCKPCPVLKPDFICASDNQTYSSECRLDYHNCVHKTWASKLCAGFCPCKSSKSSVDFQKEEKMKERWNTYMSKFQNTLTKVKYSKGEVPEVPIESSRAYQTSYKNKADSSEKNGEGGFKAQHKKICTRSDLKMMGDRLLDWFSVVMSDHQKPHSKRRLQSNLKSPVCKPEVKWMFVHLDSDSDVKLSLRELYDLEHDDREQCLQPYLSDCDANRDLFLSIREWCNCFEKSKRPCIAAQERSPEGLTGAYVPQCDEEGYYRPRQCHTSISMCWCVDKHGVEFTNTRRRGYPDCAALLKRGHQKPTVSQREDEDDDDDSDSYEDEEGSADKPLDF